MIKSLVIVFSAVALLSSTAAFAGEARVEHQKTVSYGDLNLNSQNGITTLQSRILAAAAEVCSTSADKTNANSREYNNCQDTAVRHAIADVGRNVTRRLASMQ